MQLNLLTRDSQVQRFAAAARAASALALDFTVGSVLRALAEANAALGLWLQWQLLRVLSATRLSTSQGVDVDSFVGDFSLTRLPAVSAGGLVTFGRYFPNQPALIPVGAQVKTADGTQTFSVVADPGNPFWTLAGILIPAGVASAYVVVQAVTTGATGNVAAGTVSLIASALSGVDTVLNTAPFAGGADPEADAALRTRFALYIDSRSRATRAAVIYAIESTRQGLSFAIQENMTPDGATLRGFFTVTIDDGTGSPPAALLDRVGQAIEAVRPIGSTFAILPPQTLTARVVLTITPAVGYSHDALVQPVQRAVLTLVDGLNIGDSLGYGDLYVAARGVPGVARVNAVTLNGGTADIGGGPRQVVRAVLANITVN